VRPRDVAGRTFRQLAVDLVAEVRRLDRRISAAEADIATALDHTGSTLTELFGIGTGLAGKILARVGAVHRFRSAAAFAAYNGTAPIEVSSGEVSRHRLSRAGDRQLNHALHMMALFQIRHDTEGRTYYQRKRAQGKSHKEAMRCLKLRLSDIVYRQLLHDANQKLAAGPGGHSETALTSSVADWNPEHQLFGQVTSQTRRRTPYNPETKITLTQRGAVRCTVPRLAYCLTQTHSWTSCFSPSRKRHEF
jgi:transposase